MVAQEGSHACGAACVRQLLRDAGHDLDEAQILAHMRHDGTSDIPIDDLRDALNELHPESRFVGGTASLDEGETGALSRLAQKVPFIALIRSPSRHWIIVDDIKDTEVRIRDPASAPGDKRGRACTVDRKEFETAWANGLWGIIVRTS